MAITPGEFRQIAELVYRLSGNFLTEDKAYLVEGRLKGLLAECKCSSYGELCRRARGNPLLQRRIVEAIVTTETQFFRDDGPFRALKYKILPEIIDRRSKGPGLVRIRIWSAGCSTGQEVYSIAITVKELLVDLSRYLVRILGTDISDEAIAKASRGIYSPFEIERGLSRELLFKYFERNGDRWKVKDELRALVTFRRHNLLEPFEPLGVFDVIFCRNVLIYFKPQDRKGILQRMARVLEPDGYLLLGASESLAGICDLFEPVEHFRTVIYRPRRGVGGDQLAGPL